MISNLMAQSRGNLSELPSKNAVRHSILNTIRAFNVKFKDEYRHFSNIDERKIKNISKKIFNANNMYIFYNGSKNLNKEINQLLSP